MTNKAFSRRMLDSKKRTGSGTQSYKWKYHPTPWKIFVDAVTKPQETILPRFGSKRFVLAIVALAVIIGGVVLAQGPLFHEYIQAPKSCLRYEKLPSIGCTDPFTLIWDTKAPLTDLREFNVFFGSGGAVQYTANCVFTTPCIKLGSDTLGDDVTSIALSNSTVGDLSVISGKALFSGLIWRTLSSNVGINVPFGFYLTTNGTVPHHDLGATTHYDPRNDGSVSLVTQFVCTANCLVAGSEVIQTNIYFLRTLGVDNIMKEDKGCGTTSGSLYMCGSGTFDPSAAAGILHQTFINFTGVNAGGGCGTSAGPGCSFLDSNGAQVQSSQTLPWFNFQSQQYYIGFYVLPGLGTSFEATFDTGNGANQLAYYVNEPPTAVPPNIDTGGFFGPIIKGLISIGVFIAQNIINFLAFLANVLFPVLATVFGVLANALVGALNAIGNFFGLGNIGTTIQSFFTAIGNFLVNGVSAVIGQIGNAVSFFVNGTTAFVNIAGTYWAKITSFFTALGNLLSIVGTVLNDFLIIGGFSGNLALFMDWTWGMYKTYDEGTEGFHRWLDFNENVFLRVGKVAYFLSDHLFTIILRVKQLIVQWV